MITDKYFEDPNLANALGKVEPYRENSGLFEKIIYPERKRRLIDNTGLFREFVLVPPTPLPNGRWRSSQEGYRINIDEVIRQGIDPSFVLFFRLTQPSEKPKPEWFWTSDYFETRFGLQREIPPEQRSTAVILVADLLTINENHGLIQDINDDNGLAVRQIGFAPFDQKRAIARFGY